MSDAQTPTVLTFGESMGLITQPTPGRLVTQRQLSASFGGAESNVAIALSRLGTPVTFCTRLGTDSFGDVIERELLAEGVHTMIERDRSAPTGLLLKERPFTGQTRVSYYRAHSAASRMTPSTVPTHAIEQAALVHVTGITPALSETAAETVLSVITRAREANIPVSFDLNYRSALWSADDAGELYRTIIPLADLVFCGDDEAALAVSAGTAPQLAQRIRDLGPRHAIIKLGSQGCYANVDAEERSFPAVPISVVDTVGAGDAFVAGYLAEFLRGETLEQRLETAVRAGAFACLSSGDWEGLPQRTDLEALHNADPVAR